MIHRRRVLLLPVLLAVPSLNATAQKKEEVLLSFSGTLKLISRTALIVEPEPDNQMSFLRTKKTRFLRSGKAIDADAIKTGAAVTVQCFPRLNGELEAVTVTMNDPADQDASPIK